MEADRDVPMPVEMFNVTFSGEAYLILMSVDIDDLGEEFGHPPNSTSLASGFMDWIIQQLISVHTVVNPVGGLSLDFDIIDNIQGYPGDGGLLGAKLGSNKDISKGSGVTQS